MSTTTIQNNQPLAVCLHASASSSRQWGSLTALLEANVRAVTPDLVGYGKGEKYRKGHRLSLDQEVQNVLRQVKEQTGKDNGPLHLVGHSYGAAVALRIALTYPERVASLTLYEPPQFLLLFADGLNSQEGREILALRKIVNDHARSRRGRRAAAREFIDYWSGEGSWDQMSSSRQHRIVLLMPKVIAEMDALLSANTTAEEFANLNIPVRLILGSDTKATARKVAEVLNDILPNVETVTVDGAAHMAPATHARQINPLFVEHIVATQKRRLAAAA
jgi:pimeloyl-ACP methyl ester carboxylesterase